MADAAGARAEEGASTKALARALAAQVNLVPVPMRRLRRRGALGATALDAGAGREGREPPLSA